MATTSSNKERKAIAFAAIKEYIESRKNTYDLTYTEDDGDLEIREKDGGQFYCTGLIALVESLNYLGISQYLVLRDNVITLRIY